MNSPYSMHGFIGIKFSGLCSKLSMNNHIGRIGIQISALCAIGDKDVPCTIKAMMTTKATDTQKPIAIIDLLRSVWFVSMFPLYVYARFNLRILFGNNTRSSTSFA